MTLVESPTQLQIENWDEAYSPNPDDANPNAFHEVICFTFADALLRRSDQLLFSGETSWGLDEELVKGLQFREDAVRLMQVGAKFNPELTNTVEEAIKTRPLVGELIKEAIKQHG
jgi:hypothetical protein